MFNTLSVTFECPKCKKTLSFKVEDAFRMRTAKCSCGAEILLDGAEARKKFDELERLTHQLGGKTLGR